jgi:Asp-tRNA(Asn)/Glu-tRNA(Gln) amidotransferase B subunit
MAYATDEVTEIQEKVVEAIQTGRTVQRWIVSDGQFAVRYARARTAQADTLFDRMEAVEEAVSAGTMDSHAARVVLDSMRWRASKLAPKVYGDRLDVQVSDTRISISGALQAAQSRLVDVVDVTPRISASIVQAVQGEDDVS